jgi:hypothetical protein
MAVPGFAAQVRRSGTSTSTTDEACEQVSGNLYQVTNAARRVIDPTVAWHFKDDGATVPYADIVSLDYVNGQVLLSGAPVGDVEFNGSFLPLTTSSEVVAEARSYTLSESTDLLDTTVFAGSTEALLHSRMASLKDASIEVESIASVASLATLETYKNAGTPVVVEIYQGSTGAQRFRGFCLVETIERSGEVAGLIQSSISFKISAIRNETSGLVASYAYKTQP